MLLTWSSKLKVFPAATGGTELKMDGSDNKFPKNTLPKELYVEGKVASGGMAKDFVKVALEGALENADEAKFTVMWVQLKPGKHMENDSLSVDNEARQKIHDEVMEPPRFTLGAGGFSDRIGIASEFCGDVLPNDFDPRKFGITVHLTRLKHTFGYTDNNSTPAPENQGAEDTPAALRDDCPSISGQVKQKLYNFDNPGFLYLALQQYSVGTIRRYRGNFQERAIVSPGNVRCSSPKEWYSVQSWKKVAAESWQQINDIPNDNKNGDGQITHPTWNLQAP